MRMSTVRSLGRKPPPTLERGRTLLLRVELFTLLVVVWLALGVVALPPATKETQKFQKPADPEQIVLPAGNDGDHVKKLQPKRRKLHGRFLHITDIHPDPYYARHAPPSNACHVPIATDPEAIPNRRKNGDGDDDETKLAGKYGAPTTSCDTPETLVNATFDWIKKQFMQDDVEDGAGIDFVIWTGDSARHDNDVQRPRTWKEILDLNTVVMEKMKEVFGDKEGLKDEDPYNDYKIPIIPTMGNNDIMPHNIFLPGPTTISREYLHLWRSFIPEDQYHIFDRGAYFWREVVPGNFQKPDLNSAKSSYTSSPPEKLRHGGLAVISLNSMYFFSSNSAVDGCDLHTEPGYEQFEWLRHQLQLMRDTGMKAILIGHVPPARVREVGWREGGKDDWEVGWRKRSWDETCWRKWVAWNQQYRDVIVGGIFGHMNLDHFMILDTEELKKRKPKSGRERKGKKGKKAKGRDTLSQGEGGGEMGRTQDDESPSYSTTDDFGTAGRPIYRPGFTSFRKHPTIIMTRDNPFCSTEEDPDQLISVTSAEDYLQSLRETFKRLPPKTSSNAGDTTPYKDKIGGKYGERFIVNLVSPSVVPNYFPTLRVIEYNITGLVDDEGYLLSFEGDGSGMEKQRQLGAMYSHGPNLAADALLTQPRPSPEDLDIEIAKIPQLVQTMNEKKGNNGKKPKNPPDSIPEPPPKGAPPGPGHMNQPFSLLGYTQYFANLTRINGEKNPKASEGQDKSPTSDGEFYFEAEYDTRTDEAYGLKDMTVKSYLKLARRLVDASQLRKGKLQSPTEDPVAKTADERRWQEVEGTEAEKPIGFQLGDGHSQSVLDFDSEKKKKKKKHRPKGDKKRDWIWREFLNRAFVGTLSKRELDDLMGYKDDE